MSKFKPRTVQKKSSTIRSSAGIGPTLLGCHLHRQKRHRRVASCQFYRLVITCQQLATNLSILSSCKKSVKIRLVATCHLQIRYNLLKQLAESLWITSFDNQLATSLLTTCNRLVVNKLPQTMRTHSEIKTHIYPLET